MPPRKKRSEQSLLLPEEAAPILTDETLVKEKRAPKRGRTTTAVRLGSGEEVNGTITRVLFARDGFAIVSLREDGTNKRIAAKGPIGEVEEGQHITLRGEWVTDPKWGEQLKVSYVQRSVVSGPEGIKRFLMLKIKGIGEKTADDIVARWGERTFEVLEDDPTALESVGIGPGRAKQILVQWKQEKGSHQGMAFLLQHGLGPALAQRVYARYGENAEAVLRKNPYILTEEVEMFGFKRADDVARSLGVPGDSPFRIRAGVVYALGEAASDSGHTYLTRMQTTALTSELLAVDAPNIAVEIDLLAQSGTIVVEDDRVYSAKLHRAEVAAASTLAQLQGTPRELVNAPQARVILDEVTSRLGFTLSTEQEHAALAAMAGQLLVITGGPGTGKTTIIHTLCEVYERLGVSYALLSPTGKAAKRLAEVTGRSASTIHRYLHRADPEGKAMLPVQAVIIDESSMLDIEVASWFLRRLGPQHRLVLVGDSDQLPSVGAGAFLKDLINTPSVSTVRLREIFRQALDSGIVLNAHRINDSQFPQHHEGDCEVILKEDPAEIAEIVRQIAVRENAIVLTPQRPGEVGVLALNKALQERRNPKSQKGEHVYGQITFREGDPIIVGRNDYNKEIFNGEVGEVIRADARGVTGKFDEREVEFLHGDLSTLSLCYALTIHKSQGSEYEAVVIPCVKGHFKMLAKNLLYTAVTRARKRVFLVGQRQAIWIALRNAKVEERNSYLSSRLGAKTDDGTQDILF